MRILVIHQFFLGRDDPGGSRWNQFARFFAAAGHEVTILAGMVPYFTGAKPDRYNGRILVREEEGSGVTVWRCHVSNSYNRNFIGRFWAYLSFLVFSTLAGILKVRRPDVIIATSPPLTVAPIMWLLARMFRCPAVFEVRDLWPESAIDTGVLTSGPLIKLSYLLEKMAYRKANWINALTPAFVEVLATRKHVARRQISMIPNGADVDLMTPGPKQNHVRQKLNLREAFIVSYFGAHGRANRVGQLLDVAERLRGDMPDLRIMLVGDGMEKSALVEDARRRGLDNVIFVDAVPKEQVGDYINASDICTAVLMKNDTFKTVYPNKIFDYMCCERPIIIAIDGVARELVEVAGAGMFSEPENPEAFAAVLHQMRSDPRQMRRMGEDGRRHALSQYSRDSMARKYLDVLQALAGRKSRATYR